MEKFDISELLAEASVEVDALIKAETERLESLKKSESSSSKSKSKIPDVEESGSAAARMMGGSLSKEESSDSINDSHSIPDVEQSGSSAARMMGGSLSEGSSSSSNGSVEDEMSSESSHSSSSDSSDSSSSSSDSSSSSSSPSSSSSVSKDESSYESQSPESESESGEDLEEMLSGLDDGMLEELEQALEMEKERREGSSSSSSDSDSDSSSDSSDSDSSDSSSSSSSSPSESSSSKSGSSLSMAYKNELANVKNKLAKSENQSKQLEKSFNVMADLLEKMLNKPVVKAVTDIRQIDYIDKGEKDLKKSEVTDSQLDQKLRSIASDYGKLGTLTKNERDAMQDYFINKHRTPEVLKIYFK